MGKLVLTAGGQFLGLDATVPAFSPADLSPILWLNADSLSLNDGDPVSSWLDSTANGHDASGSGGTRPTFATGALNSLPAVRLDGSKQMTVANLGAALSSDNTYTVFILAKPTTVSNYPIVFTHPTTGLWDWILEWDTGSGFYWGQQNGNYRLYATATTDGSVNLLSIAKSASTAGKLYKNGSEITSFSTNGSGLIAAPSMTGDMLLGQYTSGGFGFSGDFYEFVICDTTLSDSDRQKVEGYLAWKWGLVSSLPSDHPYKNGAP
jgi:hypothetical protein